MAIEFVIPDEEAQKAGEWLKKHEPICKQKEVGAIGGKYTWSFTQTGLGCIMVLKCACGKDIDVTDYENW